MKLSNLIQKVRPLLLFIWSSRPHLA